MAQPFSMAPDFSWVDEGTDPVQAAAEAAAARTANAVRSHYGRPEGKATAVLDSLGTSIYNTAAKPARIWGALGEVPPGQPLSERPDIVDAVAQTSTDLLGVPALLPGGIVKGAAGIFGGKLAQTADHAKLAQAEKMAAAGEYPDVIHAATGWHQGADGKWRFEINDQPATVRNGAFGTLGGKLDHPELYAAYPDLAKIEMSFGATPGSAYYDPGRSGFRPEKIGYHPTDPDPTVRSNLLHEAQHTIQEREGFGQGGAPNEFTQQGEAMNARDALAFRREMDAIPGALSPDAKEAAVIKQYVDMGAPEWIASSQARMMARGGFTPAREKEMQDLIALYGLDKRVTPYTPKEIYKRLAGEVEARNVQHRADWDMQKRAIMPPSFSQEFQNADQVVRDSTGIIFKPNRGSERAPLSLAPGAKPSREAISEFSDQLKQKHGLSHLSIYPTNAGDLNLSMIEVPREMRKQGIGTAALRDIVDYADQNGMRLTLTPGLKDSRHGTTSRSRLVDFYKQFGFVENKGRNKDFTISEGMYRPKRGD